MNPANPVDPALLEEFLRQGTLALGILALITGWLVPKYVVQELRARIKYLRKIVDRQAALIEALAAKAADVTLPPRVEDEDEDA